MTHYGKVAQAAVSAASLLAEHYKAEGGRRLNSREIAENRKLSQAIVAKVLTTLSQTGLVNGAPGPGGGYWLARPPQSISLNDVISPFERLNTALMCPFGEDWCGTGPQCPLHHQFVQFQQQMSDFLHQTTLAQFQKTLGPTLK